MLTLVGRIIMRFFVILLSVFFLAACSSDHPANGSWKSDRGNFFRIEPNGEHSFIVTHYKRSLWDGNILLQSELAGTLEGDVIKIGNHTLLHKRKADELVYRGNQTYKRIKDSQLNSEVRKSADRTDAKKAKHNQKIKELEPCLKKMGEVYKSGKSDLSESEIKKCLEMMSGSK